MLKVVGASWLQTKISSYILGTLGLLAILALFIGHIERIQEDGNYAATVFYSDKTGYRIEYWGQSNELANIPKGVARAHFKTDIDTTGWSLFEVETDGSYPDEIQAYAAGIVEGALTWYLIHTHLENTIRAKCDNTPLEKQCNKLKDALDKSVDTWKAIAAERAPNDPYWHQVSLYYTQMNGVYTGWKHGVERRMFEYETDISDLYWLNFGNEILEIQHKLNITINDSPLNSLPDLSSAFLRIANATAEDGSSNKKLFVAQNAAGRYTSMTRILKRYKLNYHSTSNDAKQIPGTSIQFSSYPGSITSQDEFYIVKGDGHEMVITGTPLRNYNEKLWKDVNITEQLPIGPRVTAANHLATNVSSWSHVLASSNSGTACKQWLVVDFNKFHKLHNSPKTEAKLSRNDIITESTVYKDVKHTVLYRGSHGHTKGLVALVEQVPSLTHFADISDRFIEKGYWATYGLPYFKDVTETTHTTKMETKYGNIFSETESPRAAIFKQRFENVTSLSSIFKLMRETNITALNRLNNGTNIFDENGYWASLGVRGDIIDNQEPYGVIDTKVVSATLDKTTLEFVAISGPPYTEMQPNDSIPLNKGNLAPIYTQEFDNKANINGLEIRDLVKQQQEEAEQERKDTLDLLNRNVVKPFEWSESQFKNLSHEGLPDKWAFGQFSPRWSW